MKIFSEKTNKEYKTVEECEAAEKEYDAAVLAEQTKREELAAARKARAKEVEDAFAHVEEVKKQYAEALEKARAEYADKLNAFIKDYGQFHMTVKTGADNPFDLFDIFNKFWF